MSSYGFSLIYVLLTIGTTLAHLHHPHVLPNSLSGYRRPACRPDQTCSYKVLGLTLSFCDCPEVGTCQDKYSVKQQTTVYNFCQPYQPPICWENDVAMVITGIQTSVRCICPDTWTLRRDKSDENGDVEFRCYSTA